MSPESYAYRRRIYDALFASLFPQRSVLVLNEVSGMYAALAHRAGAMPVAASTVDPLAAAFMARAFDWLGAPVAVLESSMAAWHEGEVYVDMAHQEAFDCLLAIGQIWRLFREWGSFDAIVEAWTFFVREAIVLDWNDANWASPPPPPEYNLDELVAALRRNFHFVVRYSDWLVVATSKLPTTEAAVYASRFCAAVTRMTSEDSHVLVVSKGDDALVTVPRRLASHFPQTDDGRYAGYHPRDSSSAITELESLRAKGATHFIIPQPSLWWLDHYLQLREHLERSYVRVDAADLCVAYELSSEPT